MKIVGISLSAEKPSRVAVLSSRGRLIALGTIQAGMSLFETAKQIEKYVLPLGVCLVVFEKPDFRNKANELNFMSLATMIQVLLSERGFAVREVRPGVWREYQSYRVSDVEKTSIVQAEKIFGGMVLHPLDAKEADALNIAYYAMQNTSMLLKGEL